MSWESVITCVSTGKLVTQYSVTPEYKLMIGLRDSSNGDILWNVIQCGSFALAVSEWEMVRTYMEEGISSLPADCTDELEEGTVEFFNLCRESYREEHSSIRYFFGFLILQFFSGWTLPCYISAWINNRPKASFSKEVLKWSKPLPPDQHVKPSKELLNQSLEIRKAFSEGKNFMDYFRIKNP